MQLHAEKGSLRHSNLFAFAGDAQGNQSDTTDEWDLSNFSGQISRIFALDSLPFDGL